MSERDAIEAIAAEVERQVIERHNDSCCDRKGDVITLSGYVYLDLAALAAAIERRK